MKRFNFPKIVLMLFLLVLGQNIYSSTKSTEPRRSLQLSDTAYLLMPQGNSYYKITFGKPLTQFFKNLLEDMPPNKKIHPLLDFYASELMTRRFIKTRIAGDPEALFIGLLLVTAKIVYPEFTSQDLADHINAIRKSCYTFPTRHWAKREIENIEEKIIFSLGPKIFFNLESIENEYLRQELGKLPVQEKIREKILRRLQEKYLLGNKESTFKLTRICLFLADEEERSKIQPFLTLLIHRIFRDERTIDLDPSCLEIAGIYLCRIIEESKAKKKFTYEQLQIIICTIAHLAQRCHEDYYIELIKFSTGIRRKLGEIISLNNDNFFHSLRITTRDFSKIIKHNFFINEKEFNNFKDSNLWFLPFEKPERDPSLY